MRLGLSIRDDLVPALCLVGIIAGLLGGAYYALFNLSKPTVYPNLGLAAYRPPPATRLVPLPRVSDAPDIPSEATTASEAPSTALAQAPVAQAKEPAPPDHKRARASRADPHAFDYAQSSGNQSWGNTGWGNTGWGSWSSFGYASQRDNSSRGGGSSPAYGSPARPRMSGGPKSSF